MADRTDAVDAGTDKAPERQPQSLFEKIIAVMGEVGFIEKREARGKGLQYDYISHDDVAAVLRPALIKHGIVVFPTIVNHSKDGNRTELTVDVSFINAERPDERITVQSIGYGVDNSDKGPGKAMSYAVKYACMKLFMLNSADDIENVNIEHDGSELRASQVVEQQTTALQAQRAWATTFKAAILSAGSEDEINELQRDNRDMLKQVPEETRTYFIELIENEKAQRQAA